MAGGRVLRFPLTRIVLGFLAIIVVGNLARVLGGTLYEGLGLGPWRVTSLGRAVIVVGAAYVLTRRLWLPIGIHFAWNFLQAGVFGGTRTAAALGVQSLLDAETSGPDLLSGGGSGLDGSVFAVTLCLAVAAALLVLAHRRGRFRPPFWRRWRAS